MGAVRVRESPPCLSSEIAYNQAFYLVAALVQGNVAR